MPFHIDIVVLSNLEKDLGAEIECLVGLPDRNPWSLPFAHKSLFVARADQYDVFIYSEDDILIEEINILAFLQITPLLKSDEIAGFLRIEKATGGGKSFPDMHDLFHWDPQSVQTRGDQVVARCTNEHSACYILTKSQLRAAINSGGFSVTVHQNKYDLPCTAATDPYTQCGMTKLIPVSSIENFCVHHMSNKYVGKMGIDESEMRSQIEAIIDIAKNGRSVTLFNTETKLPRALYSKSYYEPVVHEVMAAIPASPKKILSIGCGWGAIERALAARGEDVTAIPLDPIIGSSGKNSGISIIRRELWEIEKIAQKEKFDCILCLNVLHLLPNPDILLENLKKCLTPNGSMIIQSPNMLSIGSFRWTFRYLACFSAKERFETWGVNFSSTNKVRQWCAAAGLVVREVDGVFHVGMDGWLQKLSIMARKCLPKAFANIFAAGIVLRVG
jgi:2-polyprenyl-3-methyl-5-hydroxy-6-metoxy-1,4-benzoquinol methylase